MNLTFVRKEFFPTKTAKQVNSGDCFNWVFLVFLLFEEKNPILYSDNEYFHAFIKIGDLFFDAECPKGVTSWEELPTYKRYPEERGEVLEYNLQDFFEGWESNGKHWDMLYEIPELVKNYHQRSN